MPEVFKSHQFCGLTSKKTVIYCHNSSHAYHGRQGSDPDPRWMACKVYPSLYTGILIAGKIIKNIHLPVKPGFLDGLMNLVILLQMADEQG